MLSHELRTPLNAIVGWTHLLKKGKLSEKDREHGIDVIDRNATAQRAIIDELLDVSRIVTGKLKLEKGVDGYDFMRKVRELEDGHRVSAIAVTGYAGAIDESKALDAGYEVHLSKPIDLSELATAIARLSRKRV